MLIDLITEGESIATEFFPKRRPEAVERYREWARKVEVFLLPDAIAAARFRNAEPVSYVYAGMASANSGTWQKLKGQLAVLIELAKERTHTKPDEVFAMKPTLWGISSSTN